jgi:UPF0755 protein
MSDFNSPASGKPRRLKVLISLALVALILVGFGYFNRSSVRAFIDNFSDVEYSGTGTGSISFTIAPGETGTTIAKQLAELGVTKDYSSTLRHIVSANPTFYPGTYSLPLEISSDRAIQLLTDSKNQVTNTVTIPEGLRLDQIYKRLSTATGIKVGAFRAAAKDPRSFGLPKAAPSVEGYLFPATYSFDPNLKAVDILTIMIDRMKDELARYGVAKKDWHKTLTLASVVQREARLHDDFYKVARVFTNRLAIDMPLQSCATASYGVGSFSIIVTNKILNDDNPYNTYKYAGLPLGPIAAPGSLAIDATLHPADGSWLYFVTWNLQSGETIFSDTYAQHLAGVAKWDKWMAENPGWDE